MYVRSADVHLSSLVSQRLVMAGGFAAECYVDITGDWKDG